VICSDNVVWPVKCSGAEQEFPVGLIAGPPSRRYCEDITILRGVVKSHFREVEIIAESETNSSDTCINYCWTISGREYVRLVSPYVLFPIYITNPITANNDERIVEFFPMTFGSTGDDGHIVLSSEGRKSICQVTWNRTRSFTGDSEIVACHTKLRKDSDSNARWKTG
jgi:hypothetical protein